MAFRPHINTRPRRARKMRKMKSKPQTSLIRAVAKKVLHDAIEDKYVRGEIAAGGQPVLFNSAITSPSEQYSLLPPLVQGVDSNQRIGDKVRPTSLRIDMYITANGLLTTSMLQRVRIFMLEDRTLKNFISLTASPVATQLLDFGGFLGGFSGLPNTDLIRVNQRRYKVIRDKSITLCKGTGLTPGTGGLGGTQTFVGTQQYHKMSVKIPTPATLHYANPSDPYPTNFAPFLLVGYTQPDGDVAPDVGVQKIAVQFSSHLDYEDA